MEKGEFVPHSIYIHTYKHTMYKVKNIHALIHFNLKVFKAIHHNRRVATWYELDNLLLQSFYCRSTLLSVLLYGHKGPIPIYQHRAGCCSFSPSRSASFGYVVLLCCNLESLSFLYIFVLCLILTRKASFHILLKCAFDLTKLELRQSVIMFPLLRSECW